MNDIISLRVDRKLKEGMQEYEEINWSAIIRKTISQKIEEFKKNNFDLERARRSSEDMDKIRKSRIFDKGKSSVEIIREWRNKRKF